MSNSIPTFVFDNITFPISITIGKAYDLKSKHGFNLLKLFEEDNLDRLILDITFNDELCIELWWEIISTKFSDRENAVNKLTRDDLTKFKEAYWAAIVNFSDPAGKQTLLDMKKRFPELIRSSVSQRLDQAIKESQNENSESTSQNSM